MSGSGHALRERLAGWIEHLEHVLPAQAPIRNFVHHNTLHGLQHLPFPEALAEAARLTGARPWAEAAQCRAWLAAGRIAPADLDAAFAAALPAPDAPVPGWPALTRRAVLHEAFRDDLSPPSAARIAWLQDEGALLRRRPHLSPAAAARLRAAGDETAALRALWAAADALLGTATPAPAGDDVRFAAFFPPPAVPAEWRQAVRGLWHELASRVGREWTLAALLARLTGEDVLETVRPLLIRQLAAHLDLGVAGWRNPARAGGFYAAWRASAGVDWGWELAELVAARDEIAALPDDPVDVIARELIHLGPNETHWGDYLQRLALDLPGWSGMFLWRDRHGGAGEPAPVAMADYLAVRLVLERLCCEDLVRRTWGLPLFLSELGDHFLTHPAELWVRHARFSGGLSEADAQAAQRLIDGEAASAHDWEQLAERASAAPAAAAASDRRWPLFVLAQRLGIDAAALAAAGRAGAEALLAAADLDPDRRGYVWLLAYEENYRRQIYAALAANHGRRTAGGGRAAAQLVFCMDDREEGTRRHLEEVNPALQTFGAAGFFGVPMWWRGLDDAAPTALCPVVVTPANEVRELPRAGAEALADAHARRRSLRLEWQQRLHGATRDGLFAAPLLTALAAPLAAGALALQALAPTTLGRWQQRWREGFDGTVPTRLALTAADAAAAPPRAGFTDEEQVARVAGFLVSIGLTRDFAPLVVIVGHGSNSANNPHLAAYDCGACSGRHGGPNARALAAMANRPEVRAGLAARGLRIPDDCHFLGAEHNTGDETLAWFDADLLPERHRERFAALCGDLAEALARHAVERCRRFASAPPAPAPAQALAHLAGRRHDWSQARPELGHATVAAAFIGRRAMSRGAFFDRRVFLISYDPDGDADGAVLEAILLAAGPVGAGIALEYYFSTVDNLRFGCGSKIAHNLAGLVGVMDGTASDLRTGLPRQMIEIHEPMRLLVVLEQTRETVAAIYARQPPLAELIGNGWINVAVQEPASGALFSFDPVRGWLPWHGDGAPVPRAPSSAAWLGDHREPLPPALLEPAP
ncbi:DUF2309 domain-containing protein [Azospira restricta]|uniref:Probable inorganic carbon transporter subunit DabA n=1 Tax=Azospira restricta TaxID=404405 RepID=A0A974SP39_9RHOO|nr:DUF2309 domain-containing protein [Azospira restricta]QRJ63867.1 DUF2309 domain-containing protein [Azospira restricta]